MKWALITGATAGIGEATAKILAKEGYNLYLTGRRRDRLEKLSDLLQSEYKVECTFSNFDISKKEECQKFFKENQRKLSQITVLINNAGLALGRDPFQDSPVEDMEVMIDTNVKGLLYITKLMVPQLIEKKQGHIVNIGSVAGRWAYPGGAVYSASKFAVRAISEALRMDLQGTGIRVTNIEPGMAETEFSMVRFKDAERAKSVYKGMTPLTPNDVAETIAWCLNRPAHVNIQELLIFPTDQASIMHVHRE